MAEAPEKKPTKKEPAKGLPQIEGLIPRGEMLTGRVVSDKMKKTVIVSRDITKYFPKYKKYARSRSRIVAHNPTSINAKYFPKYKKYARSRSRIVAHNPTSINAKVGDLVTIAETRKLSKTKAWTVVEIIEEAGE